MDYRESDIGRRRSWYGAKKHLKRALGWRAPNALMRAVVRFAPSIRGTGRLPAPAHVREVEGHVGDARFTMLRPDRCVVAKELYWGKGRRPRAEDDFALQLFATLATKADMVFDIGAYTGIFTLAATSVNPVLQAHAFEIVPEVYAALRENCVRNGILPRVSLHQEGVGAPEGSVRVPTDVSDSALPDFFSTRLHFESGELVKLVSLDSLAGECPDGARVLIKIDVEGTENEVFRYGQEVVASFGPDILCEVLDGVADAVELQSLLSPHGYRFYLVRAADLLATEAITPDARYRDWFFSRRSAALLRAEGIAIADN
jgi:FkbM family methyltransferase